MMPLPGWLLEKLRRCDGWDNNALCDFGGMSIGSIVCQPPHMKVDELINMVDRKMHEEKLARKKSGRTI